eukprot:scaffold73285_cov49-Cyclotella_meneghiniana.AAC.1
MKSVGRPIGQKLLSSPLARTAGRCAGPVEERGAVAPPNHRHLPSLHRLDRCMMDPPLLLPRPI